MRELKILVDVPIHEPSLEQLRRMPGVEVQVIPDANEAREIPSASLRDKNVLFCTFPPSNLQDLAELGWIQIASSGYSQLFGLDLPQKGIKATNMLGVFDIPIAEWNIAMIVNLARDMRAMIRHQENAIWDRDKRFQREVRGSVIGLWGYGGIGRETARLAKTIGLQVHVLSRSGVTKRENIYCVPGTGDPEGILPDHVFTMPEKNEFLRGLDFLILATPETKTTTGMVGEDELRALPRHTFILNPARGALIQEESLVRALSEGWIAGAALDTHYYYPMPEDHPLWKMPNVIMTPHISGSSESPRFLERIWEIFLKNVGRYQGGTPLLNELSASQLDEIG